MVPEPEHSGGEAKAEAALERSRRRGWLRRAREAGLRRMPPTEKPWWKLRDGEANTAKRLETVRGAAGKIRDEGMVEDPDRGDDTGLSVDTSSIGEKSEAENTLAASPSEAAVLTTLETPEFVGGRAASIGAVARAGDGARDEAGAEASDEARTPAGAAAGVRNGADG